MEKLGQSQPILSGPPEWLIVGLGNPGTQYEFTRHNAGFLTIDQLAKKCNVTIDRIKFKGLCADAMIWRQAGVAFKAPDLYEPQRASGAGSSGILQNSP